MAKIKRVGGRPKEGLTPENLAEMMTLETASIVTDYIRQYVGVATETPTPGSGIFINQDRVLRMQTFQETAWYDLYAELEKDPQIGAVLQTRRLAVANQSWQIVSDDENNVKQRKIAEFVQHCLEDLENFNHDIYELLDAIGKGFAVSEIVWGLAKRGGITPTRIMSRPQRRFQFDATTRALKLRNISNPFYGDPLPERKFIVHRGATNWENPFGDALDQSLYWMWLFKRTVLSFWMKKNEVDMSCVPLVSHPAGATPEMKKEALEIAQSLRVGSAGRIPDNFTVQWAESASAANSADQYYVFVEFCDAQITKRVLGQVLTTEGSGQGGAGSKALGGVHNDVRGDIAAFDSRTIEGTINSTLIKWLVDLNYGEQEYYPKFQFKGEEVQDKKLDAEVVKALCDAGFKPTWKWVSEKFEIELEEEKEVAPSTPVPAIGTASVDEKGSVIQTSPLPQKTNTEIKK